MKWLFKWHFILYRWYRSLGNKNASRTDGSMLVTFILSFSISNLFLLRFAFGKHDLLFEGKFPKFEIILILLLLSFVFDGVVYLKGKMYLEIVRRYRVVSVENRKSDIKKARFAVLINPIITFFILGYLLITM